MRCRGAKSFVDDLVLSRGVVLSRAATLLRSIETKPFDSKICPLLDGQHLRSSVGKRVFNIRVSLVLAAGLSFFFICPSLQ